MSTRACVFVCVCERNLKTKGALLDSHCMYSYGSETRVNLTHMCIEGDKYTKCACVIPMPTEKRDMSACERDCAIHSRITI